jgi:hypothetical protein
LGGQPAAVDLHGTLEMGGVGRQAKAAVNDFINLS